MIALLLLGCAPAVLPFETPVDEAPGLDSGPLTTAPEDTGRFSLDSDGVFRPPEGPDDDRDGFRDILLAGTDCDDEDPQINPDAFENLWDAVDSDCNDDDDRARLRGVELTWNNARRPVALVGERWLIVGALDTYGEGEDEGTLARVIVYDREDLEAGYQVVDLMASPQGHHTGLELALRGDTLVGALGGRNVLGLTLTGFSWNPAVLSSRPSEIKAQHYTQGEFLEVDTAANFERWLTVGCTARSLHIMTGAYPLPGSPDRVPTSSRTITRTATGDANFSTCFAEVDADLAWATACGREGCSSFLVTDGYQRSSRWADADFEVVDAPGRWLLGVDYRQKLNAYYLPTAEPVAQELPQVFTEETVRSASAAWLGAVGSGSEVLAVVGTIEAKDGAGMDVELSLRRPDGQQTNVHLLSGVDNAQVSAAALDDVLLVAATVDEDGVGVLRWSFYTISAEQPGAE